MSERGGDWRSGPRLRFFWTRSAWRRSRTSSCGATTNTPPITQRVVLFRPMNNSRRRSRAGGCDFAVDPRIRADRAITVWLPQVDPGLALLTRVPAALLAGPDLAATDPTLITSAAEGDYLALLALAPSNGALLLPGQAQGAVAFVLPLDDRLEERLATARRLHRLLVRRRPPPATLTTYRRRRLKLALRALDGSLAGADYRAVAEALFGEARAQGRRVPRRHLPGAGHPPRPLWPPSHARRISRSAPA